MSASWSRGPPRRTCYFRPNSCSLLPWWHQESRPRDFRGSKASRFVTHFCSKVRRWVGDDEVPKRVSKSRGALLAAGEERAKA